MYRLNLVASRKDLRQVTSRGIITVNLTEEKNAV